MRQVLRPGALGRPRGIGWRGRWEGGSGWGIHVNPWLIHFIVWQNPLQYCKVISLQLIKKWKLKNKIMLISILVHLFNRHLLTFVACKDLLVVLVVQLCLTLRDPMDCSPPGSSVHGILQARILQWVAFPFSRASSRPRDQTQVSCIAGRFFTIWAIGKSPRIY